MAGRSRLHTRVKERIERFPWLTDDGTLFAEVELVEEGLVGDAPQGVINAHVERVAIPGQCEAIIEVGTCQFVLNVTGLNLRFQECESSADAILLRLEEIYRHRPRIMSLQKFGSLGLEIVTFEHVCVAFLLDGGVELGELSRDEVAQRLNGVFRDLDAPVVLLNRSFDIRHIQCFTFTVGALGVPTGTDEVRVDDAPPTLGIGHHEPGATLTTEHSDSAAPEGTGPLMAEPLRQISGYTPLGAASQSLTAAWYGHPMSLVPIAVMVAWTVPLLLIAMRTFRWR